MARSFDGSADYLNYSGTPPITFGNSCTLAMWYRNGSDTDVNEQMFGITDNSQGNGWISIAARWGVASNPVGAFHHSAGTASVNAQTTTFMSTSTWHHICGTFLASGQNRTVIAYLDAGGKNTAGPTDIGSGSYTWDRTTIGGLRDSSASFGEGTVAWPAIWDVVLTDAEVAMLAAGAHPFQVRPDRLVFFAELTGANGAAGNEIDLIGGLTMAQTSSPAVAESNMLALGGVIMPIFTPAGAGVTVNVDQGAFTLAGNIPTISTGVNQAADTGVFTLAGNIPTISTGVKQDAAEGAFTLAGNIPTISTGVQEAVDAGTFTLTGNEPTVTAGAVLVNVAAGVFTLAGNIPTISTGVKEDADAGAFTLAGNIPTISTGVKQDADTGTFTLVGNVPTITHEIPVSAGAFTLVGNVPTISTGVKEDADTGTFSLTGNVPTITATEGATNQEILDKLCILLQGKRITDPATGIMTQYDLTGAAAYVGPVFEDADGKVPYRGKGIDHQGQLDPP